MTSFEGNPSQTLVSADWLARNRHRDDLVIVEISGMGANDVSAYGNGHVPGALNWQWQQILWDPIKRDFPVPELFAERMKAQGIGDDTTVVFYGEDVQFGSYAWWVLRYCGHENVKLLDGGRLAWRAAGFDLEVKGNHPIPRSHYTPRPRRSEMRVFREHVLDHCDAGKLILDARSPEEYTGKRLMPYGYDNHGAVRYGRIPGARHVFYLSIADEEKRFKTEQELSDLIGEDLKDKEVIVYCRLSHRASFLYFALTQILKHDQVRLYDGSWTEWGSLVGYPIELELSV